MHTDLNLKEAGQLLARFRREAALTQTKLAELTGISRSMIAQAEIGDRYPSRTLLRGLAHKMGLTAVQEGQLLLAYHYKPAGGTPAQIEAVLLNDETLNPDQVKQIAGLVRTAYAQCLTKPSR